MPSVTLRDQNENRTEYDVAFVPRVGERTNLTWQDQTAGFYYVVVDALLKTGFTPDEIGKIGGGNFLRVFGEAVRK